MTYNRPFTLVGNPTMTGQASHLAGVLVDYATPPNTLATLTGIAESPNGSGVFRGACAAFDPRWMGQVIWTFTGGTLDGRVFVEDFGTVQGPNVLRGVTVFAAGGGGNQPAVDGQEALAFAAGAVLGLVQGEDGQGTSKTLTLSEPYNVATIIAQFTVDTNGNRSALTIPNLPS